VSIDTQFNQNSYMYKVLPGPHTGQQLPSFVIVFCPCVQIGRAHKTVLQSARHMRAHI